MKKILIPILFLMTIITSCGTTSSDQAKKDLVVIETTKGVIKLELKKTEAPLTVANFEKLIGQKFYDGLTFHRVEPDFVIQGGDPKGNGQGGSSETVPLEIACTDGKTYVGEIAPRGCMPLLPHTRGAVAMARTPDPNSATSQFYITLDDTRFLDGQYAVFGYVVEGIDVVKKIQVGDKMTSIYKQ